MVHANAIRAAAVGLLLLLMTSGTGGCNVIGVVASKLPQPPELAKVDLSARLSPDTKITSKNEAKNDAPTANSVAIIVWSDRGLNVDWPLLRNDLSGQLLSRLKKAQTEKAKTLAGVTFPYSSEQVVRWQRDNPAAEALPVTEIAKMLKVDRLIYLEIIDFKTRTSEAFELFRGEVRVTLKVVGVDDKGNASVVYDESGISVNFPRTAPEDGTPKGSDRVMYAGVMTETADELTRRFISSEARE